MVKTNGETHKPSGNMVETVGLPKETVTRGATYHTRAPSNKFIQDGPKNPLSGKITILPEPE